MRPVTYPSPKALLPWPANNSYRASIGGTTSGWNSKQTSEWFDLHHRQAASVADGTVVPLPGEYGLATNALMLSQKRDRICRTERAFAASPVGRVGALASLAAGGEVCRDSPTMGTTRQIVLPTILPLSATNIIGPAFAGQDQRLTSA